MLNLVDLDPKVVALAFTFDAISRAAIAIFKGYVLPALKDCAAKDKKVKLFEIYDTAFS